MRILSYRGPASPGGVSTAISNIFKAQKESGEWWFVRDNKVVRKTQRYEHSDIWLNAGIVEKHYRFCNNFLWPVMHDLPELAHLDRSEFQAFRALNYYIASEIDQTKISRFDQWFVNDYQLALVPRRLLGSSRSMVFWHIPWPKYVRPDDVEAVTEITRGLLGATAIGFHTAEYRDNFLRFVGTHISEVQISNRMEMELILGASALRRHRVKVAVAPLGIDGKTWSETKTTSSVSPLPYVLSVDRADFTKGIAERMTAIGEFFSRYPQWLEKVNFLQIITRSRQGLPEFDKYWSHCQALYAAINDKFSTESWQPIMWMERPRSQSELASLYRHAAVMLVNPLRDGLNLTAKEFVACQDESPGVLLLSRGAGVANELMNGFIPMEPTDPIKFADSIFRGLTMKESERIERINFLKMRVDSNSLESWWRLFCQHSTPSEDIDEIHIDAIFDESEMTAMLSV